MKKLFIHAGMPKTGTTSIQTALKRYRAELGNEKIFYPDTGRDNHPAIISRFHPNGLSHWYFDNAGVPPSSAQHAGQRLVDEINDSNMNAVISSEYLSTAGRSFENLVAAFPKHEPIFVFYVRHPVNEAVSLAQQTVKAGTRSIQQAIELGEWNNALIPIRKAQQAGAKVRVFDFGAIDEVTANFFWNIGSNIQPETIRVNESISMDGALLADIHADYRRVHGVEPFPRDHILDVDGTPFALPEATLNRIRDESADYVSELRNEFRMALKEKPQKGKFAWRVSQKAILEAFEAGRVAA